MSATEQRTRAGLSNRREPCIILPFYKTIFDFSPGVPDEEAGRKIKGLVRDAVFTGSRVGLAKVPPEASREGGAQQ